MRKAFSIFILIFSAWGINSANAAVWQATQEWTPAWEKKYSDWIHSSFNEEIFVSGRYKGLPTDCSDAVYAARAIFSYENKLPFAVRDATGGSNQLSNKMSRFDSISDPLQRARKFVAYVGEMTSTNTLPSDTYPVAVNRTNIRPGTVWTRPRISKNNIIKRIISGGVRADPGHAEIVKTVSDTGVLYLIGSTVPKAVRQLHTTSSLVFMPIESSTGLRNWMLPEYYGRSRPNLPGYSLEQFSSIGGGDRRSLSQWTHDVQRRLALRTESKSESIQRQVEDLCSLVKARVDIVAQSEARRQHLDGSCMKAGDYDSYSTPSRDKRIKETILQIIEVTNADGVKELGNYLSQCSDIRIAPGRSLSLYDFAVSLMKGRVSSNPNHNFEARWGLGRSFALCRKY
jgi:hypothetical protein